MRDPTAEDVDVVQPPCGLMTPEASVASLALPLPGTGATRRSARGASLQCTCPGASRCIGILGHHSGLAKQNRRRKPIHRLAVFEIC